MSHENVEKLSAFLETWTIAPNAIWHNAVEVWRRGDADMSIFDSDVTYEDENLPDHVGETYRGHVGVLRAAERWIAPFESLSIELTEIIDIDDRLLSLHRWRATAQHTGLEFNTPLAYIWTFRDGKIIHFRSFLDTAQAFRAAGLAGDATSASLDLVRSIYADWERGDFRSAEWAGPDIEYVTVGGPEPGSLTAEHARGLRDFLGVWDGYRTEAEAYRPIDSERILVLARSSGRGESSGLEMGRSGANLFHIRGGKVTRVVFYWARDRAFADLGLRE